MALRKKEDRPEAGAPAWMVTYGDMVTLLLTFFVMLLAMSEVKKDDRFLDFMQAIREAFGYIGGVQHLPTEDVEMPRNMMKEMLIVPIRPYDFSESPDDGIRGKHHTVTTIRPGERFAVGGKLRFAELSVELGEVETRTVAEFADQLRGFTTLIEVRGHCSRVPVAGTEFVDHYDLSYRRARAVTNLLILHGIDARRLIIVAAGTNQPVTALAYNPVEREQNDLVELLQIDQSVDEFQP